MPDGKGGRHRRSIGPSRSQQYLRISQIASRRKCRSPGLRRARDLGEPDRKYTGLSKLAVPTSYNA